MNLTKQDVFAMCLENGGVARVNLQWSPGLIIPFELDPRADTVLEYGHYMPNPIPDLEWTHEGIHATLSFNAIPHKTFVPWDSVLAIEPKGRNVVVVWKYDDSAPALEPPETPTKPSLSIVR